MLLTLSTIKLTGNLPNRILKRYNRIFTDHSYVTTKEIDDKALIILDRPETLNTLTRKSLAELAKALKTVENEKSFIILKSSSNKVFSSGADLKILSHAIKANDFQCIEDTIIYLNFCIYLIHKYKIPIVTLMDGYTMGGGAGICAFTTFKIATERTVFAMPEVKLGFHPNAAATYYFNRTKGKLGYYLALTGSSLKGPDVFKAGFATHYCQSKNLKTLEQALINCSNTDEIKMVVDDICEENVPKFSLNPILENIDRCFSEPTVEKIISKLEEDGSNWAIETLSTLRGFAPTCLKVTLRQLQKGQNMSLVDVLLMEANLTFNFSTFSDALEGTGIFLTGKNDLPKWNPSKLDDVSEELIENHFKPVIEAKQRSLLLEQ